MDTNSSFPERMVVYESRNPFIRKIFEQRIQTAIEFAEITDKSKILDVGCNTGRLLRSIRSFNSNSECWGIDIEPKIMTLRIQNCTFRVGDVRKLPLPNNYFTLVFVLDVLEHIKEVKVALKEIRRVLIPGGHVILSGPTESIFYKFGRFIEFGHFNISGSDHFHTIYDLEKEFIINGYSEIKSRSLPGLPLPTLFKVSKFRN